MTFKSRLLSSLRKFSSSSEAPHDEEIVAPADESQLNNASNSVQQFASSDEIKQLLDTAYRERLSAEDRAIKEAHKRIEAENIAKVTAEARIRVKLRILQNLRKGSILLSFKIFV